MGQIVDESLEADAMLARDHNLLAGNPLYLKDLHFQNMGFVFIFNLNIINFARKKPLYTHYSLIFEPPSVGQKIFGLTNYNSYWCYNNYIVLFLQPFMNLAIWWHLWTWTPQFTRFSWSLVLFIRCEQLPVGRTISNVCLVLSLQWMVNLQFHVWFYLFVGVLQLVGCNQVFTSAMGATLVDRNRYEANVKYKFLLTFLLLFIEFICDSYGFLLLFAEFILWLPLIL